jgi:hypothetical protein
MYYLVKYNIVCRRLEMHTWFGNFSPTVQCQNRTRITLKIKSQIHFVSQGLTASCFASFLSVLLLPCLSSHNDLLSAYDEPGTVVGVQWGIKYAQVSPY